jgi:hypothetical protein
LTMRRKFGKRRKNLGMLGGSEVLVSPLVGHLARISV